MKKVMLGVSLYPEQETLEEIDAYLKKASAYGFQKHVYEVFDRVLQSLVRFYKNRS